MEQTFKGEFTASTQIVLQGHYYEKQQLWKLIPNNNLGGSHTILRLQQSSETKLTFVVNTKTLSALQTLASGSWSQPASLPDSLEPGLCRQGCWATERWLPRGSQSQPGHREGVGAFFCFHTEALLPHVRWPLRKDWALCAGWPQLASLFFK